MLNSYKLSVDARFDDLIETEAQAHNLISDRIRAEEEARVALRNDVFSAINIDVWNKLNELTSMLTNLSALTRDININLKNDYVSKELLYHYFEDGYTLSVNNDGVNTIQ